jgi:hypothetical protein
VQLADARKALALRLLLSLLLLLLLRLLLLFWRRSSLLWPCSCTLAGHAWTRIATAGLELLKIWCGGISIIVYY